MPQALPSLLRTYFAVPSKDSLFLLTSILATSTNWLVLRYVYSYLQSKNVENQDQIEIEGGDVPDDGSTTAVVLLSFMLDFNFWKDGSRRLGIDLAKLTSQGRFCYMDGLGDLFAVSKDKNKPVTEKSRSGDHSLERWTKAVLSAVQKVQHSRNEATKVVLIIDHLDLLLATGGDDFNATQLGDMLVQLRTHVHSTILTMSADSSLVRSSSTPVESQHASLLLDAAHQADLVMSLRLLDTGTARDISGVMRITPGGASDFESSVDGYSSSCQELLYHVGGDSGATVFERGQ